MGIKRKFLADTLTVLRLFIAGFIVLLSFFLEREDLIVILYLTLAGWASDSFDGPLARSEKDRGPSWIGARDHYVDLLFACSLLFFLWHVNFVATHTVILYLVFIILYFIFGSKILFQLYMALIYGTLLIIALINERTMGVVLSMYAVLNMIVDWKRFKKEARDFIGGFLEVLSLDFLKRTST